MLTLRKADDFVFVPVPVPVRLSSEIQIAKCAAKRGNPFFVQNIRPLLTLMKVCGLLPVHVSPTAGSTSTSTSTSTSSTDFRKPPPPPPPPPTPKIDYPVFAYSLILWIFVFYNIVLIYVRSFRRLVQPKIPFIVLTNICVNLLVINLYTLIPYTHWLFSKNYIAHISQWQALLTYYEQNFGSCPDIKAKKYVFAGICMIFVLIVLLGGILAYGLPDKIYVAVEVCGIVVILTSSATLWCQLCRNAALVGHDLRTRVKNTIVCSAFDFHTTLRVWLKLSTITRDTGDTFTKLVAVSIFLTVLSGVLAAFGEILNILKGYTPNSGTLVSCFFTFSDFYNLYLICNVSYKASESVGRKMLQTILKRNYSSCDLLQLQQIETILLTMKISNPQIHLAGFIRINRKLLVKIYSTLATCLIVLTQFQLTMPYDTN